MPNKEELLQSITQDMTLNKAFFLRVYGYEISYPSFSETVIKSLESVGCSKARMYYQATVHDYEVKKAESLKLATKFLKEQYEQKAKNMQRSEELRKQELTHNWMNGMF